MEHADLEGISFATPMIPHSTTPAHGLQLSPSGSQDDGLAHHFGARAGLVLMRAILDHVHFGVAVVGPRLRLVFANEAAMRECASHPMLRMEQGHLVVVQPRHHGEFRRALDTARSGRWSLVQLAHAGDRVMLAIVPLRSDTACDDAQVLVVFGLCSPARALAIQFYAQTCGMTSAEARVLRALSDGLSPREIALRHDVAVSTVRTQLGSIRSKTGAGSITDLVRTLGSLPPIMPAALRAA